MKQLRYLLILLIMALSIGCAENAAGDDPVSGDDQPIINPPLDVDTSIALYQGDIFRMFYKMQGEDTTFHYEPIYDNTRGLCIGTYSNLLQSSNPITLEYAGIFKFNLAEKLNVASITAVAAKLNVSLLYIDHGTTYMFEIVMLDTSVFNYTYEQQWDAVINGVASQENYYNKTITHDVVSAINETGSGILVFGIRAKNLADPFIQVGEVELKFDGDLD